MNVQKAYTQERDRYEVSYHALLKTTNVKGQTGRNEDKIPQEATPVLSNVTARMERTDNRKPQFKHCVSTESRWHLWQPMPITSTGDKGRRNPSSRSSSWATQWVQDRQYLKNPNKQKQNRNGHWNSNWEKGSLEEVVTDTSLLERLGETPQSKGSIGQWLWCFHSQCSTH